MICSCLNAGFLFAEMCPLLRLPSTIHSLPRKHHKNRTWVRQAVSRLFCIRFSQHFSTLFFWIISQAKGRSLADGGLFCDLPLRTFLCDMRTFWSIYRRLSLWDIWGDAEIHSFSPMPFITHFLTITLSKKLEIQKIRSSSSIFSTLFIIRRSCKSIMVLLDLVPRKSLLKLNALKSLSCLDFQCFEVFC